MGSATSRLLQAEFDRLNEIEAAAKELKKLYIKNEGTSGEFIACITPNNRTDPSWLAWDRLVRALKPT